LATFTIGSPALRYPSTDLLSVEHACCAIELSPAYVDVAVRWQRFTGGKPMNAATGEAFPETDPGHAGE